MILLILRNAATSCLIQNQKINYLLNSIICLCMILSVSSCQPPLPSPIYQSGALLLGVEAIMAFHTCRSLVVLTHLSNRPIFFHLLVRTTYFLSVFLRCVFLRSCQLSQDVRVSFKTSCLVFTQYIMSDLVMSACCNIVLFNFSASSIRLQFLLYNCFEMAHAFNQYIRMGSIYHPTALLVL